MLQDTQISATGKGERKDEQSFGGTNSDQADDNSGGQTFTERSQPDDGRALVHDSIASKQPDFKQTSPATDYSTPHSHDEISDRNPDAEKHWKATENRIKDAQREDDGVDNSSSNDFETSQRSGNASDQKYQAAQEQAHGQDFNVSSGAQGFETDHERLGPAVSEVSGTSAGEQAQIHPESAHSNQDIQPEQIGAQKVPNAQRSDIETYIDDSSASSAGLEPSKHGGKTFASDLTGGDDASRFNEDSNFDSTGPDVGENRSTGFESGNTEHEPLKTPHGLEHGSEKETGAAGSVLGATTAQDGRVSQFKEDSNFDSAGPDVGENRNTGFGSGNTKHEPLKTPHGLEGDSKKEIGTAGSVLGATAVQDSRGSQVNDDSIFDSTGPDVGENRSTGFGSGNTKSELLKTPHGLEHDSEKESSTTGSVLGATTAQDDQSSQSNNDSNFDSNGPDVGENRSTGFGSGNTKHESLKTLHGLEHDSEKESGTVGSVLGATTTRDSQGFQINDDPTDPNVGENRSTGFEGGNTQHEPLKKPHGLERDSEKEIGMTGSVLGATTAQDSSGSQVNDDSNLGPTSPDIGEHRSTGFDTKSEPLKTPHGLEHDSEKESGTAGSVLGATTAQDSQGFQINDDPTDPNVGENGSTEFESGNTQHEPLKTPHGLEHDSEKEIGTTGSVLGETTAQGSRGSQVNDDSNFDSTGPDVGEKGFGSKNTEPEPLKTPHDDKEHLRTEGGTDRATAITGKIEHAIGTILHSESLKAKGLAKQT